MSVAFAEDPAPMETIDGQFMLDLDGFDGPIDLLLQLARDKKIDLSKLSITALADQYISFIERARHLRLEIAADYLVMAAWLAYLKSRLLLPQVEGEPEPSAEELAEALAFQLRRLAAMQNCGALLLQRPRLGSSILGRGEVEVFSPSGEAPIALTLHQLLRAYGISRRKADRPAPYEIRPLALYSVEMALERLSPLLGYMPDWSVLASFLPSEPSEPLVTRSAIAALFGASLELVKRGAIHLRQDAPFSPIYIKNADQPQIESQVA